MEASAEADLKESVRMNDEKKPAARHVAAVMVLALTLFYGCVSVTRDISDGERLYRAKCSSCHRLIGPEEHEASAWPHYVNDHGPGLTGAEKRRILDFLTNAQPAAAGPSETPENEQGPGTDAVQGPSSGG